MEQIKNTPELINSEKTSPEADSIENKIEVGDLYNLNDLVNIWKNQDNELFTNIDELKKFHELPRQEQQRRRNERYENMIKKLISEKDKFENIFITENGSYYFKAHDGSTLRFKNIENNDPGNEYQEKYRIESIAIKSIFIDETTCKELQNGLKKANPFFTNDLESNKVLNRRKIRKTPIAVNAYPLEFGITTFDEPVFTETETIFELNGTMSIYNDGSIEHRPDILPPIHFGHKIIEIIK